MLLCDIGVYIERAAVYGSICEKQIIMEKLVMFFHAFSREKKTQPKKIIHAYFCLDLTFQEEMRLHKESGVAAHNCGVFFSVNMKMDQLLLW